MSGELVEIGGHPTWVDQRGRDDDGAPTVLLLHGGLSNSDRILADLGGPLAERYRVVAFDRRGHGYTPDSPAPFHYDDMATEAIAVLEQVVGGPADVVGWSDGGIVGLVVALRRPQVVDRLVVIGANFHVDGLHRPFDVDLDSTAGAAMRTGYAKRSPDGADHFDEVFAKSMAMFTTEPLLTVEELAEVLAPTLVMAGDDDISDLAHTCALYEALPAGQLAIVPATSHALPMERPAETAAIILDFLAAEVPPVTMMPERRAPSTRAGTAD